MACIIPIGRRRKRSSQFSIILIIRFYIHNLNHLNSDAKIQFSLYPPLMRHKK